MLSHDNKSFRYEMDLNLSIKLQLPGYIEYINIDIFILMLGCSFYAVIA